jgi:peptidoglycan/xylan/chitin deacetylase (PgdA/CDA1 family)
MMPPRSVTDAWSPRSDRSAEVDPTPVDARRAVKRVLATALSKAGVCAVLGTLARGFAPLILGYHRVVEDFWGKSQDSIPGMLVSRRMLEQHLDHIGRTHRFVSLDELAAKLSTGGELPSHLAALTFDDGYRDVYEQAVPLLLRKGIPATVFVVSDLIGAKQLQIHDRLFRLLGRAGSRRERLAIVLARRMDLASVAPRQRTVVHEAAGPLSLTRALLQTLSFDELEALVGDLEAELGTAAGPDDSDLWPMDWLMLADLRKKGFVVGSHGCRHALLANESPDVMKREAEESRRRLGDGLGEPIAHFAYPDGNFNGAAVQAIDAAGYQFAYTACSHLSRERPLLTIPRRIFWERSSVDASGQFAPAILDCQIQGWFAGARDCRRRSHD